MIYYILSDIASGILLCKLKEWDTISQDADQVTRMMSEKNNIKKVVKVVGYYSFKNIEQVLEYFELGKSKKINNSIIAFITGLIPKNRKKYTVIVEDINLAKVLKANSITCDLVQQFTEVSRGIRIHSSWLVSKISPNINLEKFQIALGHKFSRKVICLNPARQDNSIIQSSNVIDSLDKDINKLSMRVLEWYGWHYPELVKIVPDISNYVKVVIIIGRKESIPDRIEEIRPELTNMLQDVDIVEQIFTTANYSMGIDIMEEDISNIQELARNIVGLIDQRSSIFSFMKTRLETVAPNVNSLLGEMLSARIISHSGSLLNLAKMAASTIQILGAEKALFKALKTRTNTPKFGMLFNSSHLGKTPQALKGKVARYLANKCAIAARVDAFSQGSLNIADQLIQVLDSKINYINGGKLPEQQIDIMEMALRNIKSENQEQKTKNTDIGVSDTKTVNKQKKVKEKKGVKKIDLKVEKRIKKETNSVDLKEKKRDNTLDLKVKGKINKKILKANKNKKKAKV